MVAHSGITKLATGFEMPFFKVDSIDTGMVAAEEEVPSAVKYAGNILRSALKGFLPVIAPAIMYWSTR